ncbi:MAG: hypothetical protein V2A58_13915 [Planctomycetota bacterium]
MKTFPWLERTVFWGLAAGSLVLVFLLMLAPRCVALAGLSRQLETTRREARALFGHVCSARADVSAMRHDPYFVEKTARIELGLRRPGEKEMVLSTEAPRAPLADVKVPEPGLAVRLLTPFAEDPLFRCAVFLTAVSMFFVAFVTMSQTLPSLPEVEAALERGR